MTPTPRPNPQSPDRFEHLTQELDRNTIESVDALRDLALAQAVAEFERDELPRDRIYTTTLTRRVLITDLNAIPREDRTPQLLKELLQGLASKYPITGVVLTFSAHDAATREPALSLTTHNRLEGEQEAFVWRGGRLVEVEQRAAFPFGFLDEVLSGVGGFSA